MLNVGSRGGWGADANTASPNPFDPATPPSGNPFAKPSPNPFLQNNNANIQSTASNPFHTSTTQANPFSTAATSAKRSASPSSQRPTNGAVPTRNPFEAMKHGRSVSTLKSSNSSTATAHRQSPGPIANEQKKVAEFVQPAWATSTNIPKAPARDPTLSKNEKRNFSTQGARQNGRGSTASAGLTGNRGLGPSFGSNPQGNIFSGTPDSSPNNHDGRSRELARKIQQQLYKDRIKPPQWPVNPGSHVQRQAMESFRESYKTYREKARKSLIRAGLIDDPDQRRTLQQALDFRGTSEEMCPEWEKITRIIEYDVRNPEKAPDDSGDLVAVPSLMVKRLARSAAGQDAPLPMDVRSFATLRKTLDYLIDDLIPDDSSLPSKHNFLWDRTRAIRIDLSVQKYNLTPGERADLVYCLETIARFHVTALHLLSQDGFAADDFSEQQEIEQLGKTLISLKELYDDCVEQGIECANEAEFRAYYIVFNARNPSIKETVEGWGTRLWHSDGIRTAMCLVESLQNTWTLQGPLNPNAPTELALGAAAIFFSIVSSPQISYTMACFAEIHFNDVRKSMLQILRRAYTRPRDGPKDITPGFLQDRLRFDTEDEAIDFAEKHGIIFGQEGGLRYAILNSRQSVDDPRIRHTFSRGIVERKRSGRSLPDIIHHTVYQADGYKPTVATHQESLFVADTNDTSLDTSTGLALDSDTESSASTVISDPPVATNSQSLAIKGHNSTKPPTVAPFLFPNMSQPTHTSKPPANTTPSTSFIPSQALNSQAANSPNGLHASSDANQGATKGISNGSQPNASAASQGGDNNDTVATSSHNVSVPSSTTTSPSIFSFLNKDKNVSTTPIQGQPQSSPLFGPTKTALFPTGEVGNQSHSATIGSQTTAAPSSLLAPSRTYIPSQDPRMVSDRPSFGQASPMAAPGNDSTYIPGPGSSTPPKASPASLFTRPGTNTPNQLAPTSKASSESIKLEPEASYTTPRTPGVGVSSTIMHKKDPMGDFTRWFVLADKGLLHDELVPFAVEHILKKAWEDFKVAEAIRIQQEEDAKSWTEALKFRQHSLKVTFFYRWRDIARKRRVIKRIRLEKEKARKWNSLQSVREREMAKETNRDEAIQEAKELVGERTKERAQDTTRLRESTQSDQSLEEALLATGVFSGVHDEKVAAHRVVRDEYIGSEDGMPSAEKLRLRSENQRRRKRGLGPLKQFPEEKSYKEGSKTAMLRAISSGAGRDSFSLSASSLRNSTFSSSYRSSLGFNKSRVAKSRSNVSDPHWRMRANGLIQMPNGEYLHETLALPMLREGKRFPGLGDYGLPPAKSFTPSQSPPIHPYPIGEIDPSTPSRFGRNRTSRSPSIHDGAAQKRKRGEAEDEDLAAYRNEAPATGKRAKSGDHVAPTSPSADQDFLDSIANLLNKVNAAAKCSSP